ncbi:MAG: hypothetical protein KDC12_11615 [Flavobacteriales bacterium]|nr:hypothetical protein [Flavobacteriales bacterium]
MKKLYTLACVLVAATMHAQTPSMSLVAEEIPITEPALSTLTSEMGALPHTYRIYAELPDDYEMQIMFGDFTGAMVLSSTTSFYQNSLGGPTTLSIDDAFYGLNPTLEFDSWLTIGYESQTGNLINVFPDESAWDVWETGADLTIDDIVGAGLLMPTVGLNPVNQADANGRILVAQITTDGTAQVCLNFQIRQLNPDGTVYDPPGPETSVTHVFNDLCVTVSPTVVPACEADFDASGHVATPDLLYLLAQFGCTSGCEIDFDEDGTTGTADLLFFLSAFDTDC